MQSGNYDSDPASFKKIALFANEIGRKMIGHNSWKSTGLIQESLHRINLKWCQDLGQNNPILIRLKICETSSDN